MVPWLTATVHSFLYSNADPEIVFYENYWYGEYEVICDQTCKKVDQIGVASFE